MDFFDALIRYETDLWNRLDDALSAAGEVSLATLEALRVVARHEGRGRVHELQEELRITVGSASKLADRLERDQLAVRHPNPHDRRSSVLGLTETGRESEARGTAVLAAALGAHLAESESDLSTITTTLRELDGLLERSAK
jgi:DNA-binding MarR family transcriptional regulator